MNLIAGTPWLWAREELRDSVDVLFVDEAGQMALADALAIAGAGHGMVLLGDPQQLAHVSQGTHPRRSGVSVLEHLLGDRETIPPAEGVFLERTWRMHPDVCRFVSSTMYDGRLAPVEGMERQAVASPGLSGSGVRMIEVEHAENRQSAPEEADRIAEEVAKLLDGGRYTDAAGEERDLTLEDILVVTPFNAQVRHLRGRLPRGARIGTVDKFQGQEAPVVFFSMTASSGEDVPRGMDFLFSRNRLNVAISRARALAVVVCSPRLLWARCNTVEQMRLVNALCSFAEEAERQAAAAAARRLLGSPQLRALHGAAYTAACDAATASRSARSLRALWACSAPVSCPRTQCQRTDSWRASSASSAWTRSWFLTGSPPAVFQPLRFQPWIHLVIESSISRESVTMQTRLPAGSARRPSSAAVYSIRLLVVCGAWPESSKFSWPAATTIAAQPPGPGLVRQAPSVQTRTSPSRASTGVSGAWARRRVRVAGGIGRRSYEVGRTRSSCASTT